MNENAFSLFILHPSSFEMASCQCLDRTQGLQVFGHMGNRSGGEGKGCMSVANAGFAFPASEYHFPSASLSRRSIWVIFCQQ